MEIIEFEVHQIKELVKRSSPNIEEVTQPVKTIIDEVRKNGDEALRKFTKKFDDTDIKEFKVTREEIEESYEKIDNKLKNALNMAAANIRKFHRLQIPNQWLREINKGIIAGQIIRPIESVGCYIPGGRAVYPSTALMTMIPAKIAGVKRIICCTPPRKDGSVNEATIVAADMAGANEIYKVGGVQAIAAMAYGTKTIKPVDKIVGPGNIFVTAAKKLVYGDVDIDFIAGPSEVLIIADRNANPEYIALEMIAQAEHDPEAASVLVTPSRGLGEKVCKILEEKIRYAKRGKIIKESLKNHGKIIIVKDLMEAVHFSNEYAPEHLIIMTNEPENLLNEIENAGSIFLGELTPVSAGDYGSGTNHVLPTSGCARMYSGLSTESFLKKPTVQILSEDGLKTLKNIVIPLAEYEGLYAHAESFKKRLAR
ncbi:MAG TPA: histidinol dehydrogenase [Methanothermobacter sp.]|nr:histidinol dehydrogenase [Methanothermobacter sp.]HOK72764.1 histidinol dehydrogenase [Methanothermobacter sp.]HOL69645.1 histidinol dehydrogenase [Methanothermobacter sp.]HPQ05228.1 histidinol dehydrogenase [Methanothermobacter sp.]HPU36466.1 histidinol dehydrogenase [Methanothermobacter sp.]